MKRLLLIIMLTAVLAPCVCAEFLGIKKASETISFFLLPPLDSLYGIQRKPDSVHIFTYADNATAATFQARSTTYPFSDISIDTIKHFSDTMYVFADQIQDIDGAGGNFTLSINVQMYYDKIPTHTFATVQIISDSLENMLDASKDSSSSAAVLSKNNLDSLQAQDGWVAKETSLFDGDLSSLATAANLTLSIDSINAILDTLQLWDTRIDSLETALADANLRAKIWGTGIDATLKSLVVSNSAGDAVQFTSTGGNGKGLQLTGTGTGSGLYSIGGATNGQGIWAQGTGSGNGFYSVSGGGATGDGARFISTAINGNGISLNASGTGVEITGDDLVDLIWNEDTTGHKTDPNMGYWITQGGLATISAADMGSIADSVHRKDTSDVTAGMGLMLKDTSVYQGGASSLTKEVIADAVLDSMEAGTARDIQFQSLLVHNATSSNGGNAVKFVSSFSGGEGLHLQGNGSGHGLAAYGGTSGNGIESQGGSISGYGARFSSYKDGYAGFYAWGTNGADGARFRSTHGDVGEGHGILVQSDTTLAAMRIANTNVAWRDTTGTDNDTLIGGPGLEILSEADHALMITAGSTVDSNAWSNGPNYGISVEGLTNLRGRDDRDESGLLVSGIGQRAAIKIEQIHPGQTAGPAIRISKDDGSVVLTDTAVHITGGSVVYQYTEVHRGDTIATLADSAVFKSTEAIAVLSDSSTARNSLLLQFLGWGEIAGVAVWSQDKPNADADTLWIGTSNGVGVIDTVGYQVIFHVGGAADDAPDSTKSYLWP